MLIVYFAPAGLILNNECQMFNAYNHLNFIIWERILNNYSVNE